MGWFPGIPWNSNNHQLICGLGLGQPIPIILTPLRRDCSRVSWPALKTKNTQAITGSWRSVRRLDDELLVYLGKHPDYPRLIMYLVSIWGRLQILQSPCRSYCGITWDHRQPGPFKDATHTILYLPGSDLRETRHRWHLLTLRHLHLPLLLGPLGHLRAPCLTLHHGLWWRHESQQLTSADVKDLRLVALGIVYLRAVE